MAVTVKPEGVKVIDQNRNATPDMFYKKDDDKEEVARISQDEDVIDIEEDDGAESDVIPVQVINSKAIKPNNRVTPNPHRDSRKSSTMSMKKKDTGI